MGYTQEARDRFEALLGAVAPIESKAMFGGVGIYADGLFFALIAEDKLYFKVDGTNQADFEAAGMGPFYPYDSPTPMRYWEVPSSVLEDPAELAVWVDKARCVAERAALKKKPRRPR